MDDLSNEIRETLEDAVRALEAPDEGVRELARKFAVFFVQLQDMGIGDQPATVMTCQFIGSVMNLYRPPEVRNAIL